VLCIAKTGRVLTGFEFRMAGMGSPRKELRVLQRSQAGHGSRAGSTANTPRTSMRSICCVTDRVVTGLFSMAIAEQARPEDDPTKQIAFVHRPMGTQF
jgi:hypothetical protein